MDNKDIQVTESELASLDSVAHDILAYSEDDRRKADDLYGYYQELLEKGDSKGETRLALAKALELKENSVTNLVDILKIKAKLLERKLNFRIKREMMKYDHDKNGEGNNKGFDSSTLISSIDGE